MTLKPHQLAMIADGLPQIFCTLTKEDRHKLWELNPPRNTPRFIDPRIEQDRLLREVSKQEQTQKRIASLRKSKGLHPFYNPSTNPNQPQEMEMPKYTIKPLDVRGHPVMRAITSINDDADEVAIDAKVLAAVERGGSKVTNVLLINTLGRVVLAWEVKEGVAGPCDAGPFQPLEVQPTTEASAETAPSEAATETDATTEEGQMAKKVKKVKVAKAKSGKPHGEKTLAISKLLTRASGCTAKEVLALTGWPSVSMPAMAKACGLKLRKDKEKGKPTRYFGS